MISRAMSAACSFRACFISIIVFQSIDLINHLIMAEGSICLRKVSDLFANSARFEQKNRQHPIKRIFFRHLQMLVKRAMRIKNINSEQSQRTSSTAHEKKSMRFFHGKASQKNFSREIFLREGFPEKFLTRDSSNCLEQVAGASPREHVKLRQWHKKREPMGFPVAESEGFKPPIPIRVYRISSPARSITLPTLLVCGCKITIFF